jgi:hypothetical protein
MQKARLFRLVASALLVAGILFAAPLVEGGSSHENVESYSRTVISRPGWPLLVKRIF